MNAYRVLWNEGRNHYSFDFVNIWDAETFCLYLDDQGFEPCLAGLFE